MNSLNSNELLLDLRGVSCLVNFIRIKLRLESIPSSSILEVWLDAGEPMEQVPESLAMEGYKIESMEDCHGFFSIKILRP